VRFRATLEYDGLDFAGWQRQPGRRSVQGTLEEALAALVNEPVAVIGAGRTDAHVHATGQVAHFDIETAHWAPEALQAALNAWLPRDMAVQALAVAPVGFHARYSALSRTYAYTVCVRPVRSPLLRRTSWHVRGPLELERMAAAAAMLVGSHDFGAFGRPMTPGGPTVRCLDYCEVQAQDERLVIEVRANAFLRHQVRRMVGLLVDVGRGRFDLADVERLLRREAGGPRPRRAPAQGLVLVVVAYPPDEERERLADAKAGVGGLA
jgi:tRNA pseudouridine38-40 synthase